MNTKTHEILKQYWGYDTFRPLQEHIISAVLTHRDVVALLPTGGGKSLTYQLPALVMDGITIVVTPLIALMKDQVDSLRKRGIRAVAINSSMNYREIDIALDNCVYGDVKLLYIAPERIATEIFRLRLQRMAVSLIAVDEAHCISQWGYDFRPSYLKISTLRELLPEVPMIAVTATATSIVLDDISKYLKLHDPQIFRASYERANLTFVVRRTENKNEHILRVIKGIESGSGIVYARTRAATEQIAEFLQTRGVSADFYHAGLGFALRSLKQRDWSSGKTRVIVATNAFGMGIDKADVRFVVHHQIPESLESYYQEAGRAGRDSKRAYAVVLYNDADNAAALRRISMEYPPIETIRQVYEALFNHFQIAIGSGKDSVHDFKLWEVAQKFNIYSLTVLNSIKILELNGYMTLTEELDNPTRIMFRISRDKLYAVQVERVDFEGVVKAILRHYTGLFTQFVSIDEHYLATVSGYTVERIVEMLLALSRADIIRYIPRRRTPLLIMHEERLEPKNLRIAPETLGLRRSKSELRIAAMIDYASQETQCRSLVLRNYFDEDTTDHCGVCDVCIERKKRGLEMYDSATATDDSIESSLIRALEVAPCDIRALMLAIKVPSNIVLNTIRRLIAQDKVQHLSNGQIAIVRKN